MPVQKHILICDDDVEDIELLEEALLKLEPDLTFDLASSGEEVIRILTTSSSDSLPSLVVLDYNMPGLTGPEVLSVVSNNASLKNIPIVVLSTSNLPQHERLCRNNGAADYFVKPSSIEQIDLIAQRIIEYISAP